MNHETYLSHCEKLGIIAKQNGNSPVGCVIVVNGQVIAEGIESATSDQNITHHAEMKAMQTARDKIGKDLSHGTLYSTHEPCVMCAYSIRFHGISTVVFQNHVANLGSYTSKFDLLTTDEVPESWPSKPEVILIS